MRLSILTVKIVQNSLIGEKMSSKTFYVKNLVIDDEYDTISSDKTVVDAALQMKEKLIPDLVVVDKDNQVLGVVADHDIVITTVATGKDPKSTKVVESMYRIEPVTMDTPVEVAFERMQQLRVTTVPVVDGGELKGVVTITDCWGYIPEKYEDYKGLLTVKNPKFANYWFTILFTLLYFFFGFLAPVIGMYGFLTGSYSMTASTTLSNVVYYPFDAHGSNYFVNYLDLSNANSMYLLVYGYSVIFVLIGLITSVLVLQWAYGDYKMIKSTQTWPRLSYLLGIANTLIYWALYVYIYMNNNYVPIRVQGLTFDSLSFNYIGLLLSLSSLVFLSLAVFRDFAFKSSSEVSN